VSSWTLLERDTYMRRVQADPANSRPLKRMNAQFTWAWSTATVLFAAMGTVGVAANPGPMLAGATAAQACAICVLFAGFLGFAVRSQLVSLKRRHWLAVKAKQLWAQDRQAGAAQHPWPTATAGIEY
jgi:hypothetical protein